MRPPIIAVDFDGTLFHTQFPEIIAPNLPLINWCKQQKEQGSILILWTCRSGDNLQAAVEACKKEGLTFNYINEHSAEALDTFTVTSNSHKVFADIYIDDKARRPEEIITGNIAVTTEN